MTDPQETVAYQRDRTRQPTWRDTVEHRLNQLDAAYTALWDCMPAIAAVFTLGILVIVTPH